MEKRTILAVVLTVLLILAYQIYAAKYVTSPQPGRSIETKGERRAGGEGVLEVKGEQAPTEIVAEKERPKDVLPLKVVRVETDKYIVTLSNEGGCIQNIILKEYPQPGTAEPFELINIEDLEEGIFNMEGLEEAGIQHRMFFTEEKNGEILFTTKFENRLELTKRYIFKKPGYHIELEIYFKNLTDDTLQNKYTIVASSNIDIRGRLDRTYSRIVSDVFGKVRRDNGRKNKGDFAGGAVRYSGLQNKYFSALTKTSVSTTGVWLRQTDKDNLLSAIEIDEFKIPPHGTISHSYLLYAGPTKEDIMESYGLRPAISYGFFGGISKVLMAGLRLLQRLFKNWGVAIILLSAGVNLLLFPLSRKSYESMKRMQELQPHMEKLRNDHKDNPQRLNKEMMELYKKYSVNPMGGCLPMLLQIPIFISLYQALMRSIELRGANFLWIKDLSMPDAVPLPFNLPILGNSVNILPVLMMVAMVFQQKVAMKRTAAQSEQQKQQQQMMMVMMPIVFLFIMYNFPSGLVLYWLTNTLLTMFEQRAIMQS